MGRGDKKEGGGLLAKGVTGLVGLATEVHKYQKDRKAALAESNAHQPEKSLPISNSQRLHTPSAGHLSEADDERLHELDDLSHEIGDEPPSYDDIVPSSSMAKSFSIDKKVPSTPAHGVRPLPYPIILPQRRPGSKGRGFIRAYPPSVGEFKGIDQSTFLNFLKEFHQQSQASHIFEVIIVGAEGAKWAPSSIAMVVGTGVQVGAVAGRELHSRSRTNEYLNKINKDLFHPVNLHALIMSFDPDISGTRVANIDTSSGLAAPALDTQMKDLSLTSPSSSTQTSGGLSGRFKIADGTTRSEAEMVHAAPLIFPSIDRAMVSDDPNHPGKQDGKMKRAGKFLSDYMDRRAQATYAAQHGADSALAVPGAMDSSRFASRFSNPNDPASKGNLKSLLPLGGSRSSMDGSGHGSDDDHNRHHDEKRHDRDRKHEHDHNHDRKRDREDRRHSHGSGGRRSLEQTYHDRGEEDHGEGHYYSADRSMARRQQHQDRQSGDQSPTTGKGGMMGGFSKFLKPGVLYLLIAEIPTREEMQDMRA